MPRETNIQIRRGTYSQWSSSNPTLGDGEFGYDKTNKTLKLGDSSTPWSGLPEAVLSVAPSIQTGGTKTNYSILISPIVDFKTVGETSIFVVPSGYIFCIEEMEILTTSIASAGTAPQIRFGKTGSPSAFIGATLSESNSAMKRHIISSPQDAQEGNTTITFGITNASTASQHQGFGIVKGYMIPLPVEPGTTPMPFMSNPNLDS